MNTRNPREQEVMEILWKFHISLWRTVMFSCGRHVKIGDSKNKYCWRSGKHFWGYSLVDTNGNLFKQYKKTVLFGWFVNIEKSTGTASQVLFVPFCLGFWTDYTGWRCPSNQKFWRIYFPISFSKRSLVSWIEVEILFPPNIPLHFPLIFNNFRFVELWW